MAITKHNNNVQVKYTIVVHWDDIG